MSSTPPSRDNGYQIPLDQRADRAFFQAIVSDIHERILANEGKAADYDEAINLIVTQALETVSATLGHEIAEQREVLLLIQAQAEELLDEYASRNIPAARVLLDPIADFDPTTAQAAIADLAGKRATTYGQTIIGAADARAARDVLDLSRGLENPFIQSGQLTENVDVVTRVGQYLVSTGAVGVPADFAQGLCFVMERWNGQLIQVLYEIVPPFSVYHRNYLSEAFGPWQRHLTGASFADMREQLGVAYATAGEQAVFRSNLGLAYETGAEKDAFRANIGAQPAGDYQRAGDYQPAGNYQAAGDYQPNLGWVPIEVVAPTVEVSGIVVTIPSGHRSIRITGVISAVNGLSPIRCRVSFDNSATFDASAIYRVSYLNRGAAVVDQSPSDFNLETSFYAATTQLNNAQCADLDLRMDYVIPRALRYRARSSSIAQDGAEREVVTTGSLANTNPPTSFLLFPELGGNISPDTRLLVEAF